MPSPHILPITHHPISSSSAMAPPTMSASIDTMFIKEGNDPLLISSSFDDEKVMPNKPLIPRTLSCSIPATDNSFDQQRRCRTASENSLSTLSCCQQNLGHDDGHTDGDNRFLGKLRVVRVCGSVPCAYCSLLPKADIGNEIERFIHPFGKVGCRWIVRFLALYFYAFLLFPGFLQVGYHYFFSKQVRRGIVYGDQPRNRLDLYLPKNCDGPKPVVAFITGGAWIIGYKAWGSLLGQQLAERDIIVASIDYSNIAEYGGDPDRDNAPLFSFSRVYLMGQSAGAHIGACTLVEQAIKEVGEGERTSWSVSQIQAYFGLSGGYNLLNLVDYFHNRGLNRSIFLSIMEGEESLRRFSPEVIVQDPNLRNAVSLIPPIILFHGTADYSIPSDASTNFAEILQRVGVRAQSILYERKMHTDVFLQDPIRGGKDQMFEDLVSIIHAEDPDATAKDAVAPPRRRLVPEFMLS